jgi:hypothetical protein
MLKGHQRAAQRDRPQGARALRLTWGGDNDTPYEMDITLDELSFIE